mmetsp:Transcript_85753/g.183800  ORF Transcript_85753/g.183800 Transcript_85753/m.183800 type:complete len:259 (+) Transcript_85753:54-830(+)
MGHCRGERGPAPRRLARGRGFRRAHKGAHATERLCSVGGDARRGRCSGCSTPGGAALHPLPLEVLAPSPGGVVAPGPRTGPLRPPFLQGPQVPRTVAGSMPGSFRTTRGAQDPCRTLCSSRGDPAPPPRGAGAVAVEAAPAATAGVLLAGASVAGGSGGAASAREVRSNADDAAAAPAGAHDQGLSGAQQCWGQRRQGEPAATRARCCPSGEALAAQWRPGLGRGRCCSGPGGGCSGAKSRCQGTPAPGADGGGAGAA